MILKSSSDKLAKISIEAICHDCKHRHNIDVAPYIFGQAAMEWETKHRGHNFEFLSPKRFLPKNFDDRIYEKVGRGPWWLDYKHNADIKLAYASDAAFTLDLANLASSSTWVSGREATSVDNTSNKYLDYFITGKFVSGTSPVSGEARIYYIMPQDDTPTWPDVFDGTDSAETVTNTSILDRLPLGWSGGNSTSTNVTYPVVNALTLAQVFGICPYMFTIFFTHSQSVNLYNNAANTNQIFYKGVYATSI
jgi:hypothetical protein